MQRAAVAWLTQKKGLRGGVMGDEAGEISRGWIRKDLGIMLKES